MVSSPPLFAYQINEEESKLLSSLQAIIIPTSWQGSSYGNN